MIIYIATTLGTPESIYRRNAVKAKNILESLGHTVLAPWETKIPNAWDISNKEWGLKVFQEDLRNIEKSDIVVLMSYGRESTAGANWECGYSFGIGKKSLLLK